MDTHTGVLTEDWKRREKLGQKIAQVARKVSVGRWSIKYWRMWQKKWSHSPLATFNSSYSSLSCSSSSSAQTFGGRTFPDLRLLWNALKTVSTISTIHSDQPWFTLCVWNNETGQKTSNRPPRALHINGMIILKWTLETFGFKMWIWCNWLKRGSNGGFIQPSPYKGGYLNFSAWFTENILLEQKGNKTMKYMAFCGKWNRDYAACLKRQ